MQSVVAILRKGEKMFLKRFIHKVELRGEECAENPDGVIVDTVAYICPRDSKEEVPGGYDLPGSDYPVPLSRAAAAAGYPICPTPCNSEKCVRDEDIKRKTGWKVSDTHKPKLSDFRACLGLFGEIGSYKEIGLMKIKGVRDHIYTTVIKPVIRN